MDPHSFDPPHTKAHKHYILHRPEVSPAFREQETEIGNSKIHT